MPTYIVTNIDGDRHGRQPGAHRCKTKGEADEHFSRGRNQGSFFVMYVEDYENSGEVIRANDRRRPS
jgi:hypothetical protein